ncbi:MAG TPA: DUF3301 domain-containing protein [Steroidobacteraceae bacterium]|nr:DUF3301 domain-containing protein [Steroidobacteraceae bacterium]
MELTWTALMFTIAGVCVAWFWQDSLRVREAANDAAMDACTKMGLQFLDGTVAFSHLRLMRDAGRLRLQRTYVFDYTSHSIDRLQGFVVLLAGRVESVGFARTERRAASGDIVYPQTPAHPPNPASFTPISITTAASTPPPAHSSSADPSSPNLASPSLDLPRIEHSEHSDQSANGNNVLDLDTWRKTRQR